METETINNKVLGYTLTAVGILMILYAVYDVYMVFNGKTAVFNLFMFNPISIDLSKMVESAPKNANLTQELIASDMLNKPMNLVFHLLFMGFIATAGQKIATIGTTLVRTIKVNIAEDNKQLWK